MWQNDLYLLCFFLCINNALQHADQRQCSFFSSPGPFVCDLTDWSASMAETTQWFPSVTATKLVRFYVSFAKLCFYLCLLLCESTAEVDSALLLFWPESRALLGVSPPDPRHSTSPWQVPVFWYHSHTHMLLDAVSCLQMYTVGCELHWVGFQATGTQSEVGPTSTVCATSLNGSIHNFAVVRRTPKVISLHSWDDSAIFFHEGDTMTIWLAINFYIYPMQPCFGLNMRVCWTLQLCTSLFGHACLRHSLCVPVLHARFLPPLICTQEVCPSPTFQVDS